MFTQTINMTTEYKLHVLVHLFHSSHLHMEVAELNWSKTGCCSILIWGGGSLVILPFIICMCQRSVYFIWCYFFIYNKAGGKYSPARDPPLVTLVVDVYEDLKGPGGQ